VRALILAAGYGERLRPLTDHTPKPLIEVNGRTLIERHLEALAAADFSDVVINVAHLADAIRRFIGSGERWGLQVRFSDEGDRPLETGGGMLRALPRLGPMPFAVVNADIITDFDFALLKHPPQGLADLVLVDTPPDKTSGDFALAANGRITGRDPAGLTYAGIGVYRPELLRDQAPGRFSIVPLLERAMAQGRVTGRHYGGVWRDVGTPERLAAVREEGL